MLIEIVLLLLILGYLLALPLITVTLVHFGRVWWRRPASLLNRAVLQPARLMAVAAFLMAGFVFIAWVITLADAIL